MKLSLTLLLCSFLFSCTQQAQNIRPAEKFVTVYTSGADSIFWMPGKNFDSTAVSKGIRQDSVFMSRFLKALSGSGKKIIFKPLAGVGGGSGADMMNMKIFFEENHITDISFSKIDSAEMKFFNDVSFLDHIMQLNVPADPEEVVVQSPTAFESKVSPDSCLLFFLTKNKLYYTDHINGNKSSAQEVKFYNKFKIIRVLNELEQKHGIQLPEYQNILVKASPDMPYPTYKILKDAFKEKNIYKFRLVTTAD